MLIEDGILLRKYWFSVSDAEQESGSAPGSQDPMRRWKLSADGRAVDQPLGGLLAGQGRDVRRTPTSPSSPWYVVESEDKKRSRLNMIAHLLGSIALRAAGGAKVEIPERPASGKDYQRPPREQYRYVPDHAASLPLKD